MRLRIVEKMLDNYRVCFEFIHFFIFINVLFCYAYVLRLYEHTFYILYSNLTKLNFAKIAIFVVACISGHKWIIGS